MVHVYSALEMHQIDLPIIRFVDLDKMHLRLHQRRQSDDRVYWPLLYGTSKWDERVISGNNLKIAIFPIILCFMFLIIFKWTRLVFLGFTYIVTCIFFQKMSISFLALKIIIQYFFTKYMLSFTQKHIPARIIL